MERIEAFEKMLADVQKQYEFEKAKMEELKASGKEKTATYRQYFGNKFMYNKILAMYKEYGLIKSDNNAVK